MTVPFLPSVREPGPWRLVAAGLAVWFCVLTLSGTLVHAHAGGDRLHTHTTPPKNDSDSGAPHRHRTLFGYDLGSDGLDGGVRLADGSDPADATADVPPNPDLPFAVPTTLDLALAVRVSPPAPNFASLCAFTRHAVSGVQLI